MKIAFIPIDNRPVCYTLAQQIADIDDEIELFLPPREMLGGLTKISDISGILNWLEELPKIDTVILSLDTIAHGGLIPSRLSVDTFEGIENRLQKLKEILNAKGAKVYACSSIMRISNNNVNEEEKEYWNLYGEKIFKYSYETHRDGSAQTDVPVEIIEDYLKTRKRNFDVNKIYLDWAKGGFFETLVFSKDDCAQFGLNVQEAQRLGQKIEDEKLNVLIKTGADEIPLSLLSRAITNGKKIKIAPVFTQPEFTDKISKYEDVSVYESVKGQIELAGAVLSDENDADIIMLVNNFKHEQGELVMGVDVEGFNCELTLPQKSYLIADILNANGADNNFVEKLLKHDLGNDFLGYSAWNTTGNTLGSGICCALVKFFAKKPSFQNFKKVQVVRFLDDWAYQANVRKILKSRLKEISIEELKKEMRFFETVLNNKFETDFKDISYSYPWDRFFEIEVTICN